MSLQSGLARPVLVGPIGPVPVGPVGLALVGPVLVGPVGPVLVGPLFLMSTVGSKILPSHFPLCRCEYEGSRIKIIL